MPWPVSRTPYNILIQANLLAEPVRTLYEAFCDFQPREAAGHLDWLVARMRERADMYRVVRAAGIIAPSLPGH